MPCPDAVVLEGCLQIPLLSAITLCQARWLCLSSKCDLVTSPDNSACKANLQRDSFGHLALLHRSWGQGPEKTKRRLPLEDLLKSFKASKTAYLAAFLVSYPCPPWRPAVWEVEDLCTGCEL